MKYCPECGSTLTRRQVDGADRGACPVESCRFVHWDNPVPVVAALVEHEGKVILARNAGWPEGIFSLVTGYLERNEAPDAAVVREVKEELGLNGRVDGFIGHYCVAQLNQLVLAYAVVADGEIYAGREIAEVRHVAPDALKNWDFGQLEMTSAIVARWLDRRLWTFDYTQGNAARADWRGKGR